MLKRVISGISVGVPAAAIMVVTGLLGTSVLSASLLGAGLLGQPARAADDCLTAPNRAPAPGAHWYYHFDRATDRKCWYLVEPPPQAPNPQMPIAQTPQLQLAPEPTPPPAPPGFGSFLLLAGPGAPTPIQYHRRSAHRAARPGGRPQDRRRRASAGSPA